MPCPDDVSASKHYVVNYHQTLLVTFEKPLKVRRYCQRSLIEDGATD
jgi:hypothetical protein